MFLLSDTLRAVLHIPVLLRRSQVLCVVIYDNKIQGKVNNDKDCMMCFSIPYDNNWNIYVDGKEVEMLRVNYGFIGAFIQSGEHEIILKYKDYNIIYSLIVSVVGAIFIVLWILYWQRKEN